MRKQTEKRLLIIFISIVVLMIVIGIFKKVPPAMKSASQAPFVKEETRWEYALADANVRSGPGTQYKIVSKLKIFDRVVIVDEDVIRQNLPDKIH